MKSATQSDPQISPDNLLGRAYAAFNARDIEAVLAVRHPDVVWPNGMEGGIVLGHAGVRDYWMWRVVDPHVEPVRFVIEANGRVAVEVRQGVCDFAGNVLKDSAVEHVYRFESGLTKAMEIREFDERKA